MLGEKHVCTKIKVFNTSDIEDHLIALAKTKFEVCAHGR